MLSVVAMWTISYAFANLFTCYPITALVEPFYGNKCIDVVPMWISVIISDIILDVLIFLLPIPMVMNLQMPLKQRLAVLCMFLLGATYVSPTLYLGARHLLILSPVQSVCY